MSTTFAQLGIEFTTRTAAKAASDIAKVENAADKAEKSAGRLGKASKRLATDAVAGANGVRKVTDAIGKIEGAAKKATAGVEGMISRLGQIKMAVAGVVAASGALVAMGVSAINTGHNVARLSSLANALPSEFQRWAAGAQAVGFEQQDLADILKDVNDRIGDFVATGGGPMADFFERIGPKVGITAKSFRDLSGPQALQLYVTSLQKAGLNQQDMTFFMEAMASESTRLIPLLQNNGAELERLADRAQALGGILSDDAVRGLAAMKQGLTDLGTATGGLMSQLGATFAPMISSISQGLAGVIGSVARAVSENGNTISFVFETVIGTAIVASTAYAAKFGATWAASMVASTGATFTLVGALTALKAALIATGIGAIVVAAGMLVGQFVKLVGATGSFGSAMTLLGEVASGVWEGIKTSAGSIPLALASVWETVKSDFFYMIADLGSGWADFLRMMGLDGMANGIQQGFFIDLNELGSNALQRSWQYSAEAAALVAKGWDKATEALEKLNAVAAETESTFGGAGSGGGLGGGLSGAAGGAGKAANELRKEVERLNKAAAAGRTPLDQYKESLAHLEKLRGAGLSDSAYAIELERINDEYAKSVPLIDSMSGALGEFFAGGMRSIRDLVVSFKNGLKQMAADAIAKPIRLAMVGNTGTPATAGTGLLGGLGTFGSALWGGAKAAGSSFISGGIGGMFGNIGGALSGATSSLAGLGTAIGAIAAPVAAVAAVFSFFSKKTKELDRGLRVTVSGVDALVEEFSTLEIKRFWGLSKKTSTNYSAADGGTSGAIGYAVAELQAGIHAAAAVLDFGADTFKSFTHTLKISTKGMSEDEALAAVQEAVLGLGDAYADLVPGLRDQIKHGEGAAAALERLSSSLTAVNGVADLLGHKFDAVGILGGALASHLADAFGGLDAMGAAVQSYWGAVYTEQERLETTTRQATEALAALGLQMPKSRAEYRAMVEALDLTNAGTHEAYAALLSLAGVMDQILPSVSGLTAALAELQGNAQTGLEASISAAQEAAKANATAAGNWYKASTSIRDWVEKLRATASPLTNPAQARANAETTYQTTLARAMAGDLAAAQSMTGAADRLLEAVRNSAKSQTEAAVAEARILSDMGLIAGVGDIEGARHDAIAGLLTQQADRMAEVRDYIAAGNALTEGMIDSLKDDLGALEEAIAAAELINYAYLKERLAVTVDVIADASIPAHLKTLLGNAANGVTGYVDFIARSDLSPDLKWLAMAGASEHVKTVSYLAQNKLGDDLTELALETVSSLQKTVNLIVGKKLDPSIEALALMQLSSGTKTVNLIAGKTLLPSDMLVALMGDDWATKTVHLAAGKSIDAKTLAIALMGDEAALKTVNLTAGRVLTADQMALALMGASIASKTINFGTGKTLDATTLKLALAGDSAAVKTVNLLAGKTLTADQMLAALMGDNSAAKTINLVGGRTVSTDTMRAALMGDASAIKTLGFKAGASVSADVMALALMGDKSATKTINEVAGKTLTADQMRAALMGDTASTKTINLANGKTVSADVMRLALAGDASAIKTVHLAAGRALDADTLRIALAGNSELARTVTATLAANINADAKRLALGNVGAYAVSVQAAFAPNISADVRRVVLTQKGDYAAMINAAISSSMTAEARRILLTQQGGYVANITGVLASNLDNATRTLLLNANTEAARAVTISAAFAKSLTADERAALSASATTTAKTIKAAIDTAGLSATGALYLAQLGLGSATVQKTLAGQIALSALSADQRLLLSSITETVTKSVAFKATGSATEDQLRLLGAVSATILRAVNFQTTGGLTTDQRAILGTTAATVQRLLAMSVTGTLTADQKVILAASAASISRTLGLTTTGGLSDDQRRVLLATSGSVARSLALTTTGALTADQKTVLGASAAAIARSLALTTTGSLTADQRKVLEVQGGKLDKALALVVSGSLTADQRVILGADGAKVAKTLALTATGALTADQGKMLAATAATIARTLAMTATGSLSADQAKILSATAGSVARTLGLTATGSLTADQAKMLAATAGTVSRTVGLSATGSLTEDQKKLLAAASATITRTVKGAVDLGALTAQQKALLDGITGANAGKLTLGGSFQFDPTTGFKTWFESQTTTAIASPMKGLTEAMGPLKTALDALRKGLEDEGKRQGLASYVSRLAGDGAGGYIATHAQLKDMAGILGLSSNASTGHLAKVIAAYSSSDAVSALGVYDGAMKAQLLSYMDDPRLRVKADAYLAARKDVAASPAWAGDPQGHWENFGRAEMAKNANWFDPTLFDWSSVGLKIPGFAKGGLHQGGLRLVGENGPELEVTGPSRIYSSPKTGNLMAEANAALVAEVKALRNELADLKAIALRGNENTRDAAKALKAIDANGVKIDSDQNAIKVEE